MRGMQNKTGEMKTNAEKMDLAYPSIFKRENTWV